MLFNRNRRIGLIFCLLFGLAPLASASSFTPTKGPAGFLQPSRPAQPGPNFVVNVLGDAPADVGCTDDDCSLREATVAANASSNVSEITFGVTGVITLTQGQLTVSSPITMTRPAGGITVSGNDAARIANVNNTGTLVLAGVNLTRGRVAAGGNGGAIVNSGTLSITQSMISDNTAGFGGAIYNNAGTVRVQQSTFSGNTAASNGGALYNVTGSATMALSTFSGNTATFGGVVYIAGGSVGLNQASLNANTASSSGGAVYATGGATTVGLSTISGNTASFGGAVYVSGGSVAITQSTLSGNSAPAGGNGGGIYNITAGAVTVSQSTLSGNTSSSNGGAIYNSATLTVLQSTITGNTVTNGGAGGAGINLQGGTLNIGQTIVSGNIAANQTDIRRNGSPAITSQGHNLIGSGYTGAFTGLGDQINVDDPQLGALQNNGGPTQTRLPIAGSPVIDAGPATSAFATDQRGFARLAGPTVDIGAVEANAPTAVTLIAFSADRSAAGVTLRWRTGQQDAVIGYRVERQGPSGWMLVGEQTLSPSGSYALPDPQALPGPQTYRLSARSADGTSEDLGELTVADLRRLYLPAIGR